MNLLANIQADLEKTRSVSERQDFELSEEQLDVIVGGINPQPLPPRSPR